MPPEKPHATYQFFKNLERLINLTDCIFAFAITLMVLSLAVPVFTKGNITVELPVRLLME
jgi:uncharacterized membrane protein